MTSALRHLLPIILAVMPLPVLAADATPLPAADAGAFSRQCVAKGPADICACMAEELQRGRDGHVVLETYAIAELPEAERKTAMATMMERYKLTQAELSPIGNAVPALLDAALKVCDE